MIRDENAMLEGMISISSQPKKKETTLGWAIEKQELQTEASGILGAQVD